MRRVYEGHLPDGSGIQAHSAGEFYPWVHTIVENASEGRGEVFYKHPDGRESARVAYQIGQDGAFVRACQRCDELLTRGLAREAKQREIEALLSPGVKKRPSVDTHHRVLPNGAVQIARIGVVVLARRPKGDGYEYVTWLVDAEGNAASGNYFPGNGKPATSADLVAAMNNFIERVGAWY